MNKLLKIAVSFSLALYITAGLCVFTILPVYLYIHVSETAATVCVLVYFVVVVVMVTKRIYQEFLQ
jgi:hypothetical protein